MAEAQPEDLLTKQAVFVVDSKDCGWFVPNHAVRTWSKRAVLFPSADVLKQQLTTPTTEGWFALVDPDSLVPIEVDSLGWLVFMSVKFADAAESEQFGRRLIPVPTSIAAPVLGSMHKSIVEADRYNGATRTAAARLDTAKWVPGDCKVDVFNYGELGWISVSDEEAAIANAKMIHASSTDGSGLEAKLEAVTATCKALDTSIKLISGSVGRAPVGKQGPPPQVVTGVAVQNDDDDDELDDVPAEAGASNALVSTGTAAAFEKTVDELRLPQGKTLFKPPNGSITLLPEVVNVVTGDEYHEIKEKRTAAYWRKFLHPRACGVIKGVVKGTEVINLFTTFRVDGFEMEDKVFIPLQQIAKEALALWAKEHGDRPVFDTATEAGTHRLAEIFGWEPVAIDGKLEKIDAKMASWEKCYGNYRCPIPKPLKESTGDGAPPPAKKQKGGNGVAADAPANGNGVSHAAAAAPSASHTTTRDNDVWTENAVGSPFTQWTKFIKVGKRFRIDTESFPGYVVVTKHHEELQLDVNEDDEE
jgi:hypothetical protein